MPPKKSPSQLDREVAAILAQDDDAPTTKPSHKRKLATDLELAATTEYGARFETGKPVTFPFLRNTEKSPHLGATYGQDIEPHGRYLLHDPDPGRTPARGWTQGTVTFRSPLVLPLSGDPNHIYGPQGWKARLVAAFGKKGKALSRAIAKTYDGIVTVDDAGDTREIVDLSSFR